MEQQEPNITRLLIVFSILGITGIALYVFVIIIICPDTAAAIAACTSILGVGVCLGCYIYKPSELFTEEQDKVWKWLIKLAIIISITFVLASTYYRHPDKIYFISNWGNIATIVATFLSLIFYFDEQRIIIRRPYIKIIIIFLLSIMILINFIDKHFIIYHGKISLNNDEGTPVYGAEVSISERFCMFDRFCKTETDKNGNFFIRKFPFSAKKIQVAYNNTVMSYPISDTDDTDTNVEINTQLGEWECIVCGYSISNSEPLYLGTSVKLKIEQGYDNEKEIVTIKEIGDQNSWMEHTFDGNDKFKREDNKISQFGKFKIQTVSDNKVEIKVIVKKGGEKREKTLFFCYRK